MKLSSCPTASIIFKVLGIYNFGAASVADGGRQWAQQAEKRGGMAARRVERQPRLVFANVPREKKCACERAMPYYFAGHASLSVISIIMIKIRQRK